MLSYWYDRIFIHVYNNLANVLSTLHRSQCSLKAAGWKFERVLPTEPLPLSKWQPLQVYLRGLSKSRFAVFAGKWVAAMFLGSRWNWHGAVFASNASYLEMIEHIIENAMSITAPISKRIDGNLA